MAKCHLDKYKYNSRKFYSDTKRANHNIIHKLEKLKLNNQKYNLVKRKNTLKIFLQFNTFY